MESSGVPVVLETCETLGLLDGWSGVVPAHLSKRARLKVGRGRGVLTLVSSKKNPIQVSSNILFWQQFTLTLTRDLGFKFVVVDMALC